MEVVMPRQTKTREHILAVAADLFGAYGLNGVSTRQIVRAANVTKTLIFYHFQSKENLYLTVFRGRISAFRGRIESMFADTKPGLPVIEAFVWMQIGFLSENRNIVRMLIRELIESDSNESDEPSGYTQRIDRIAPPDQYEDDAVDNACARKRWHSRCRSCAYDGEYYQSQHFLFLGTTHFKGY